MHSLELKVGESIDEREVNNVVLDEDERLKLVFASFKLKRIL